MTTAPVVEPRPRQVRPLLGPVVSLPNVITLARTGPAVFLGLAAAVAGDLRLLAVAYAVYWVGDIADGWVARRRDQETRLGAVLDIVCDRACTAVLCVGLVVSVDDGRALLPVAGVFLLSFMVIDTVLSLAFLLWPIAGPNDFHLVDGLVWRLNWSPVAKASNTGVVVVALALGLTWAALAVAVVVLAVKVWSARRVVALLGQGDG